MIRRLENKTPATRDGGRGPGRERGHLLGGYAIVIQIEGSSYRLRQHADLVPEHIRSKALIQPAPLTAQPKRRGRPPKNGGNDHPNG